MTLVVVTSNQPGEGKTGVAAAIARHLAYAGRPVQLARVAGEGNDALDGAFFGSLAFAPGSPTAPIAASAAVAPSGDNVLVVEADLVTASSLPAATVVLVALTVAPKSLPAGLAVKAVVVTAVPASALSAIPATVGDVPVIAVAEDRTLAGFSVSEACALLNAEVLLPGEDGDPTCDHLVISPIASDAGQPYFRRFPAQAVVVRFDKTDMHLAAMRAQPQCLILTGGRRPSDYLFDAASASGVPVLLSRTDTENTVIALEGVFDHTRFQGERKLDRMDTLLEGSQLYGALA